MTVTVFDDVILQYIHSHFRLCNLKRYSVSLLLLEHPGEKRHYILIVKTQASVPAFFLTPAVPCFSPAAKGEFINKITDLSPCGDTSLFPLDSNSINWDEVSVESALVTEYERFCRSLHTAVIWMADPSLTERVVITRAMGEMPMTEN